MSVTYIKLGPIGDAFNSEELGIFLDRDTAVEIGTDLLTQRLKTFIQSGFLVQITNAEYENIKLNTPVARNIPLVNVNLSQSSTHEPVEAVLPTPPPDYIVGKRYIVWTNATGAWEGHSNQIATFRGTHWEFENPVNGMSLPVYSLGISVKYSGTYPSGIWTFTENPTTGSFNDSSYQHLLELLIAIQGNQTLIPQWILDITPGHIEAWNRKSDSPGISESFDNADLLKSLSIVGNYLLANKEKINSALADNAQLWDGHKFEDYVDQPIKTDDDVRFKSISSKDFSSGFTGSGWRIDENGDATVDNLTVRKEFNVYELVVNKISGTNGAIAVTDTITISDVLITEDELEYICYIDTKEDTIQVPFRVDDILRCQKWNGTNIKYYNIVVSSVENNRFNLLISTKVGEGIPERGDIVARFGNRTNPDRQGLLYLTSSDDNSPYLDVLDGVDSEDLTGKTKVRVGKLDGIVHPNLGQLEGYGLYGENVYLEGKIVITGGSGYENLEDKPDLSLYPLKSYVDSIRDEIQAQVDGSITTWFYPYAPALTNIPTSEWLTATEKDSHLGDLFYDDLTGYAYRFQKVAGVYEWKQITDVDITKALADAQKAQDTADGKRRVFVTTPTSPYDIGDLWVQGEGGEILRSKATKFKEEPYSFLDWIKASKYTDDSRALLAEQNAKEYAEGLNSALSSEVTDLTTALAEFSEEVTGIFRDGIITAAEITTIKTQINLISNEKADLDNRYTSIHGDVNLTEPTKTALTNLKIIYNQRYATLIGLIDSAVASGTITPEQITDINNGFIDYRVAIGALALKLNDAISIISQKKADKALTDANEFTQGQIDIVAQDITDLGLRIDSFDAFIEDAFSDGVIEISEARAIEKYLNSIGAEKVDIDNRFTAIYTNPAITPVPKSDLNARKIAFNDAHNNLISSINAAILDNKTTPEEKTDVDNKFTLYRVALANLSTSFEAAINAIAQAKADTAEANAKKDAEDKRKAFAETLGGLAFEDAVELSKLGTTVQEGGYLKNTLINTVWLQANMVTADWIKTLSIDSTKGTIGGNQITDRGIIGAKFSIIDGKLSGTDVDLTGNINATSGTIGGFTFNKITTGLTGTKVIIEPDQGIRVSNGGYIDASGGQVLIPTTNPIAPVGNGHYLFSSDDYGSGGPETPVIGSLNDINDVTIEDPLVGDALIWTGIEWSNQTLPTIHDRTFEYQPPSASATWIITHTLDKKPSVTVTDSAGTVVTGEVKYNNKNSLTITFNAAFSGTAILN